MKTLKFYYRFQFITVLALFAFTGTAQISDSVKYDNGFLHYHEYGSKEFPPVIVLTGGPGNSYKQLSGLAQTLGQRFRAILLEQRGTGRSIPVPMDSTTMNLKSVTQDLKTLANSLGLKKVVVLGHSWGGMLAMNFAAEYPESVAHLILIAPGPHKNTKKNFGVLVANRRHTRSLVEEKRLEELNESINNKIADSLDIVESKKLSRRAYIYANPIPDSLFQKINTKRNSESASLLIRDVFENYDVSESLNNFKGKVDIISGRQDVVGFSTYELKIDRPNAKLHWINESGHFPMYEQPTEFYQILFSILDGK